MPMPMFYRQSLQSPEIYLCRYDIMDHFHFFPESDNDDYVSPGCKRIEVQHILKRLHDVVDPSDGIQFVRRRESTPKCS